MSVMALPVTAATVGGPSGGVGTTSAGHGWARAWVRYWAGASHRLGPGSRCQVQPCVRDQGVGASAGGCPWLWYGGGVLTCDVEVSVARGLADLVGNDTLVDASVGMGDGHEHQTVDVLDWGGQRMGFKPQEGAAVAPLSPGANGMEEAAGHAGIAKQGCNERSMTRGACGCCRRCEQGSSRWSSPTRGSPRALGAPWQQGRCSGRSGHCMPGTWLRRGRGGSPTLRHAAVVGAAEPGAVVEPGDGGVGQPGHLALQHRLLALHHVQVLQRPQEVGHGEALGLCLHLLRLLRDGRHLLQLGAARAMCPLLSQGMQHTRMAPPVLPPCASVPGG